MAVIEIAKIQVRRGQETATGTPTLDPGEFGWAYDTENLYIGKRVSEGATTDEPTRILVEKDLDIFRALALNTGTVASSYKYRQDNTLTSYTVTTTIQSKLDSLSPSLVDFGVNPQLEPIDITVEFRNAIRDLFANDNTVWASSSQRDLYRRLLVPAGTFIISGTIDLPPYTKIVGEGPELTRLILVNADANVFRTVDAMGNAFEDTMQTGAYRAREVHIEGMTLEYSTGTVSQSALISLDNVLNARVENCALRTQFDFASTTTYGLSESGIGIEIRGIGGGLGSGDVNLCEHIYVNRCTFDGLNIGIESTGSVVRPVIEDNIFSNLQYGISFSAGSITLVAPNNSLITKNRFENIVNEAIIIGTSLNDNVLNNISSDNVFVQCGNGYDDSGLLVRLDDNVTSPYTYQQIATDIHSTATGSTGTLFAVDVAILATATVNILTSVDLSTDEWFFTGSDHYAGEHILIKSINTVTAGTLIFETTSTTTATDYQNYPSEFYTLEKIKNVSPVIRFESQGNKTINDYFYRRTEANNAVVGGSFYYAPLVTGNTLINDGAIYTTTVAAGSTTRFAKISLTGSDQNAVMDYQMFGNGLSRKGKLNINVSPDGFASLNDFYNYTQYLEVTGTNFVAITGSSDINKLVIEKNAETMAMFENGIISGAFYITGDNQYTDLSAMIVNVYQNSSSTYLITTFSQSPEFDFRTESIVWTLLKGDNALPEFNVNSTSTYVDKNYVVVEVRSSSLLDVTIEYQINIQQ